MLRPLSASLSHRSGLALVLLLSFARNAHAQSGAAAPVNECEVHADCGHGFECDATVTGTGGGVNVGGASAGGASGTAGSAMASGGAGDAAPAAGTGSGVPIMPICGDMICNTV